MKKFSEDQVKQAEGSEYLRLMDIEPQDELRSYDFTAMDSAFVSEIVKGLPPILIGQLQINSKGYQGHI